MTRKGTSYAVSEDGVHWERPDLGVHDIPTCPTRNIVMPYGHMSGLFYEPWEPDPDRRFKAMVEVDGVLVLIDAVMPGEHGRILRQLTALGNKKLHLIDIAPTVKEALEQKKVDVGKVRKALKEREG